MNIRVAEDDATNAAETVDTDLYRVSIAVYCVVPVFLALSPTLTTIFAVCGCVWGTVMKSELVGTGQ